MLTTDAAGAGFRVVVAGGGVAGLEAVLALRELAGDRVSVTLLAPTTEFVYRPQAVREPFALGPADRYDLREMADDLGAELVVDRLSWIDPAGRMAHTSAGHALAFDALVVAVGARMLARHPLALTIDPERIDDQLHGLIQDVESGDVRSIAFIVPAGRTWLLPPYELALMTAQRAYDAQTRVQVSVVTSEDEPLGVFGKGASTGVKRLLDAPASRSSPPRRCRCRRPAGRRHHPRPAAARRPGRGDARAARPSVRGLPSERTA
jgi:sulfide:quinone oxidoreductase